MLPATADKKLYVSTAGNDANHGTSEFFPKRTIEAAVNAASTGGNIIVGQGTYIMSAALKMAAGVLVSCNDGDELRTARGVGVEVNEFCEVLGVSMRDSRSMSRGADHCAGEPTPGASCST